MEKEFDANPEGMEKEYKHHRAGRVMGGLIVVAVGVLLLLRQLNMLVFPHWVLTWPVLLIVIGLFVGARHTFQGGGWLGMMLVGGVFLMQEIYPGMNIQEYAWPGIIIAVGLFMIVRSRRRRHHWGRYYKEAYWKKHEKYAHAHMRETTSSDDYLDSVTVFGSAHRVIMSKNFKGGDIVNIFGGAEINLSQTDFQGKVTLEVVEIFGGTKIIIPPNWEVHIKGIPVFGGIDDKRPAGAMQHNPDKVLVIDAVAIFGGIEIISY
jgi:predicted membrane protein